MTLHRSPQAPVQWTEGRLGHLFRNMVANVGGQVWAALLSLVMIPVYVHFLGIESFGLIGVYMTSRGIMQLLDFGLTPTVNRQIARYAAHPERSSPLCDFTRTFEIVFAGLGLMISALMLAAAPFVAHHWLNAESLDPDTVLNACMLMGVLCGLQWPISFYHGALMGLEKQILYNVVKCAEVALHHGGAVLVLIFLSPTIESLFMWQIFVGVSFTGVLAIALWSRLPRISRPPRFTFSLVKSVWHFAAGMTVISASAIALTNIDKVILSRFVSLEEFGHYTLAVFIANGLVAVVMTPAFNAIFPRFSSLVASRKEDALRDLYHLSNQVFAVVLIPLTATIALFSHTLILLWVRDVETATNVAPVLTVYVVGTGLNGLMNPAYALQLAAGWTRLAVVINLGLLVLFVPSACVLVPAHGALACAALWTGLMTIYLAIGIPLTHTRLLSGESLPTWKEDFAPTGIVCLAVFSVAVPLVNLSSTVYMKSFLILIAALSSLSLSLLFTPRVRRALRHARSRASVSRASGNVPLFRNGGGRI